jgi:alpha-mannosidase
MKVSSVKWLGGAVVLSFFVPAGRPAQAQGRFQPGPPSRYPNVLDRLQAMTSVPIRDWRFHAADLPHPEDPALDDSSWQPVTLAGGFGGFGGRQRQRPSGGSDTGPGWYRTRIEIPATAGGKDIRGARVRLAVRLFGDGRVFFNGTVVAQGEGRLWDPILIADQAVPGQKILVAVGPYHSARSGVAGAQLLIDDPGQPDPGLLREEIVCAEALIAGLPKGEAQRAHLDAAVHAIDLGALDRGDQPAFTHSLETAQNDLLPLRDWMQQFSVRAVGNSHIDIAWLWPWTETVEVVRDTFTTALQLMREYPGFTYTQSSAQDFAWLQAKYPDLFRQIQDRVKEGRWEIVGGMWVEPDLNIPDGESLVRQLLVGKRYFLQNFGVDVKIGWNPDSFGYNWQLPQIYKKSGIDSFVTQKMSWNDTTKFPYKLFWWEAPDGSKVLTYFPQGYGNNMNPLGIARDVATYTPATHFPELLYLYGVGDHGGGPTRAMLDQFLQLQQPSTVFPKISYGTAGGFFDDVRKSMEQGGLEVPTWKDELYLEFHRGCYTTQSETKKRVRQSEELLQNAEKFASLSLLDGQAYPRSQFEDCWKRLLFDDFHDILPGSGIAVNYEDAAENLHEVSLQGQQILHNSMEKITARINSQGAGVPVVIYNPLSWARRGAVEVEAQLPGTARGIEARDAAGKPLLAQLASLDPATHQAKVWVLAKDVPPLGYEVIHVRPESESAKGREGAKKSFPRKREGGGAQRGPAPRPGTGPALRAPAPGPRESAKRMGRALVLASSRRPSPAGSRPFAAFAPSRKRPFRAFADFRAFAVPNRNAGPPLKASGTTLENEFLRVTVDPKSGCITRLFNKADHRETLAPGASANLLQAFADNPRQFDAWNIDPEYEQHGTDLNQAQEVRLVERGPVRAVIRVKKKFRSSTFVQDICLYAGVPRVDVNMQADWHEKHILLKVAFPVSVLSDFATYEIPYGTIRRPTTRNTPAEQAKFEVPALRWGDLSDARHGFSLLNDSKYGYDCKGNVLRLSLLRSPTNPDPHADEGFHEFTYALYPHAGDWQQGQSMQRAYELNFPLIPITASAHNGVLPPSQSFVQVGPGNVILTVVKKAEDDDALIFRYYEFEGKRSQVHLRLPEKAIRAAEANLMEKDEHPLSLTADGRELTVPTGPYEIKTVKVWFPHWQQNQAVAASH